MAKWIRVSMESKEIKGDVVGGKGNVQNLHVAQTFPKLHKFSKHANLPNPFNLSRIKAKNPRSSEEQGFGDIIYNNRREWRP